MANKDGKILYEKTETVTDIDENGNEHTTTKSTTTKVSRVDEPEYVKLYTKIWADFHEVPLAYQALFYELARRMEWCNANDLAHSQIVYTHGPKMDEIMKTLGWTSKNMYQKGLAALVKCNAIRKISRGVYQINPDFVGKGEWKYNPKTKHGGIEELRASFRIGKNGKKWESEIIFADDGEDTEYNNMWRDGLGTKPQDGAVLTETCVTNNDNAEGNDDWAMDELLFVDPNQTEIQTGIGDGGSR